MIRIIKGAPLPAEVRALVDAHPLGTAAHLLRAVGLSVFVGGFLAMMTSIMLSPPIGRYPVPDAVIVVAAGVALAGAVLIHQGNLLYLRVVTTTLHDSEHEPVQ